MNRITKNLKLGTKTTALLRYCSIVLLFFSVLLMMALPSYAVTTQISAGGYHTIALKNDGTLWAWGRNLEGQLGDGTIVDKNSPVQIGTDEWAAISAGGYHTIALKNDGTLWAWGYNNHGQLGDGTIVNKNSPVQIGTDNNWVSISTGRFRTIAIKNDGTLWGWGYNSNGQIGDGTNVDRWTPTQIGSDNNWVSISAGRGHTIALKSDQTLWAWGMNDHGQLGNGTTDEKWTPTQIGTDNNWVSISGGLYHTIALKNDQTLWAWGMNDFGQLGNGTTDEKWAPTQIGTDNNWVSISAGWYRTMAIKNDFTNDGTLWAWGINNSGQLGDGTNVEKHSPIRIGTDNKWISISAGWYHTIALKPDGLWAWGGNAYGQLGDGTIVDRWTPTQIIQMLIMGDLVISSLTAPSTAGAGTSISIGDTTTNNGPDATNASATSFYLSTNASLDAGDTLLGRRSVFALGAGASSPGTSSVLIPLGTATGTYYIIARADDLNVVSENNELNNIRARTISIGPDLVISSLTAPSTAGAGTSISIGDTTKNNGPGEAGASTTSFYLSANASLDGGDTPLGSRPVPALGAGASSSGTTSVDIPLGTATGTYYIIARADDLNVVSEINELNNIRARTISTGTDLVILSLTAPSTAGAGTSISIGDTTKNNGPGEAGASTTSFYLSTNASLDAGDTPLGSRPVPALGAGASSSGTTSVDIPLGTATGTYYIIARADDLNVVSEINELNNIRARTISIGPDLVISSLTAPSTAGGGWPGVNISIGDTTKNNGPGAAGASTTSFYFSANASLDAGDTLLGSRSVPELSSGASSTGTTSVTIPGGTSTGTYYIIARADDLNVVSELNELNNIRARTISIK